MNGTCLAAPLLAADATSIRVGDRLRQRGHGRGIEIVGVVVESGRARCGCGCRRRMLVLEDADRVRWDLASDAWRVAETP